MHIIIILEAEARAQAESAARARAEAEMLRRAAQVYRVVHVVVHGFVCVCWFLDDEIDK